MINVIIVEDDPVVAQTNTRYLQHFPEILVSHVFLNGQNALEHLRKNHVDLALIDISMPAMNGVELLRQMRHEHIRTDVIVVTASTDVKDLDAMLGMGIIDYLVKPFELKRFKKAVGKYLNKANLVTSHVRVDQNDIDSIVDIPNKTPDIQKGLQTATLEAIINLLRSKPEEYHSCESVSNDLKLSKVTARRYLNYLTETNTLIGKIDYETGGRPSMLYKLIAP